MSSFPTSFGRVSTFQTSHVSLTNINRTNVELLRVSEQLSTGRRVNRPSQDAVAAATIATLDSRIERRAQILQNLQVAADSLDILDGALGDSSDLLNEAKQIALTQTNVGTTAEERASQAVVIDSLLDSLLRVSNRESALGHVFGGTQPGTAPVQRVGNGYRFVGGRNGLLTDLGGLAGVVPSTLGVGGAVGELSARVSGSTDLDPDARTDTRLSELNGANDTGVTQGTFNFSFNGGPNFSVNTTDADTLGDVVDAINAAIREYEADSGDTVLGPGGVSISGGGISFDIAAGGSLVASDLTGGTVARDLGLTAAAFTPLNTDGTDLDPKLSFETPVSALNGLSGVFTAGGLGEITLRNNGKIFHVDLSGAQTLGEIKGRIEAGGSGVRVEINEDGTGINVVTEVSGGADQAFSIAEVAGNNGTASALGIRTLDSATPLSAFNDGRGVQIVDNSIDPTTGDPNPAGDVDFVITLGDGFEIEIDLSEDDLVDVSTLLAAINTQAGDQLTAAGRPVTDFEASLSTSNNGLLFTQDAALGGSIGVARRNNSPAAEQLGLLDATAGGGGTTLLAEDRATIRPDNVFTHLADLADALRNDDTFGIELAAGKLDETLVRLTETRALVGGYAQRVDDETAREEDRNVLDTQIRSTLRDTDYAAATTELSQLELQLQAGLAAASRAQQQTLLDFIG